MSPSRSETALKSILRGDLDASGLRHWPIKRKNESEVSNCAARASIECVSTQAQSEAALPIQVEDLNRPFKVPATTTSPGIKIIAQMILSRFALTQGMLPKK
jgi:hypothetical protein